MEGIVVIGIIVLAVIFMLVCAIKSDLKTLRKERQDITQSWENYYARKNEYRPTKEFRLAYDDGTEDLIEGNSYRINDDVFTVNDKYQKAIYIASKKRLKKVVIDRDEMVLDGERWSNE